MVDHDTRKEEEAQEASRLEAKVLHEVARLEGKQELARPPGALFWSAVAGGLAMGLSLLAQALLKAPLPDQPWAVLISRYGYAVGFVVVVLGRQQLFTENTLTAVIPFFCDKRRDTLAQVARLWTAVLVGNLVGTFLFALVLAHVHIFDAGIERQLSLISTEAMAGSALAIFVKAVFAGWLIAMMVWMLPSASSKLVIVSLVTYFIGLAGLSHIIAGAGEAFYAALTGGIGWGRMVLNWFFPTLLGNIVGGTALVAALNHAQVASPR